MRLSRGKSLIREVAPGQYVVGNNIFSPALSLNAAAGSGKIGQEEIILASDLLHLSGVHLEYDGGTLAGSTFTSGKIELSSLPEVSGQNLLLQGDVDLHSITGVNLDYQSATFSERPTVRILENNAEKKIPLLMSGDFFDESDFPVLLENLRQLSGHFDVVMNDAGHAYASGILASTELLYELERAQTEIAAISQSQINLNSLTATITENESFNDLYANTIYTPSLSGEMISGYSTLGHHISGEYACFNSRPTVGFEDKLEVALAIEVSGEADQRAASDLSLTTRVSTEEEIRRVADLSLTTRVSTEEEIRRVADLSLTTRVSTEEEIRRVADLSLTTRVSTEEEIRSVADLSLTTRADSEGEARELADASLSVKVEAINLTNISGESLAYNQGSFSSRPTVGGLPVLISGDAAAGPAIDIKLIKKYATIFG